MKQYMDMSNFSEEVIERIFIRYCTEVLQRDLRNYYHQKKIRGERELYLEDMTEQQLAQFRSIDDYPFEHDVFMVADNMIVIHDELLGGALRTLPDDLRDIFMMHWFLDMSDREISERIHVPQRTVSRKRKNAFELLQKSMKNGEG